ncbi:MAG: molybdopterin-dependent oxidoreductase [Nitrospira sp.]|nr:molybdopterin-dependent oxidoreductase [Nitrospira sp.]
MEETLGFPLWLRINHAINLFCMFLLMRSGLQILADHPKLYWNDDTTPGSEWAHFGKKVMPKDRLWTSMDEAEEINSIVALPGGHHNLGAARNWHFLIVPVWIVNGLSYASFLLVTGEWRRLIPTSWTIVPRAWESALTFASFHIPPDSAFTPYDPLQQLAYATVVFLVAPLMILTGLCMSPALIARFPWYPKLFGGRQAARSLHFLGLMTLVLYTLVHITLVILVHFPDDVSDMVLGSTNPNVSLALWIASLVLVGIVLFHVWATIYTLHYQRRFQLQATAIVEPLVRFFFGRLRSRQHYAKTDISPYFRVNGYPPEQEGYQRLAERNFVDWKLTISGLVEQPLELSLEDLRAFPKQEQITKHNCIQGWSAVAEWGGVRVSAILDRCRLLPQARYLVFHAFPQAEYAPDAYYEVLTLEDVLDPQTLLAYEMNWKPLPIPHGAPCRLRVEIKTGYKMVKYLRAIEVVSSFAAIGQGHGGYREDHQYYDKVAAI